MDPTDQQTGSENPEGNAPVPGLEHPSFAAKHPALHKHGHRLILIYLAVLLLTIVCGGVYSWQHRKVATLESRVAILNTRATGLKKQVGSLQAQVAAAKQNAKSASSSSISSSGSSSAGSSSASPVACTNADINLTLSQPNGTAGTEYLDAILANQSSQPCTLNGVAPQASLVTASGQTLGSATCTTSCTGPTVTIEPSQVAHVVIGFPLDNGQMCTGPATYLDVTLPGQSSPLQVAETYQYCSGFSVEAITTGS